MAVWREGRRCNRMPSKDRDRSCLGLYDRRSNVCQWMLYTILRLAQNTMIEVMNHIELQLKSTGRSEHFCPQYNDCAMNMKAKIGSMRKTMIRSGISMGKSPNEYQANSLSQEELLP